MTRTIGLAVVAVAIASAQGPAFDAASVKVNRSGSPDSTIGVIPGGTYRAINTTLARLIPDAFAVMPFQVTGGPAWLTTDRFDINARAPADARPDQLPAMLQALLVERFALKTHRDQQDRPIYTLTPVIAGRSGPKLTTASLDCDQQEADKRLSAPCQSQIGIGRGGGQLVMKGRGIAFLARTLGNVVGRIVADRSGLTGKYDIELNWSAGDATATSDAPEIFSALREQLGLQLKPATGPVEMVVIDSVERPVAD